MQSLNKNWITEHHIDFEYKKYILLAYLQHVSENFTENRLYPFLSDMVEHYRNLKVLQENKHRIFASFPEQIKGTDTEQFRLIYQKLVEDDSLMSEIESIVEFSIPQLETKLREGKKIYEFLEEHTHIFPIGLTPINNEAGYLLLRNGESTETIVFQYHVTLFEHPQERYRGVHLEYMTAYPASLANTYESIKYDLLRYNRSLPNPAAYAIESELNLPFQSTFLPLAKRSIMKRISNAA
ncbi:MAG: hypothetical protein RIQ47_1048 [Bacteroidota bacterium]|jgi:hypothetical protein